MYCPYCGKELSDMADICVGCGRQVNKNVKFDSSSVGWWWLGFFFPLVGFILWLVWTGETPIKAKKAGFGALVGVIVSVVLSIICIVGYFALIMYLIAI